MNMASEILIPILLAIIAYWVKRYIDRSDKRQDYFTEKADELSDDLKVVITNFSNNIKTCEKTHIDLNSHIKSHDKILQDHEKRILKLEK